MYAYIVLKVVGSGMDNEHKRQVAADLRAVVKKKISGFAVPDQIQVNNSDNLFKLSSFCTKTNISFFINLSFSTS